MKKPEKLDVKDQISLMYLSGQLVNVAWHKHLPEEFVILVNEVSAWRVFEALIDASGQGNQAMNNLSVIEDKTGLSRQLVSKTLNRFIKLGWVITGHYDNDKRNKLYFLVPKTSSIIAEAIMTSINGMFKVFIHYMDHDATMRIISRMDQEMEDKVGRQIQDSQVRLKKTKGTK